jgi:ABC-2 type transport system ATP-binding protein
VNEPLRAGRRPGPIGDRPTGPVASLADAAVVSIEGLTKRYGDVAAVEDLSFHLHAGTVTGFLGPNGAGKSTTLRLLLGLAEPTAGRALVFGDRFQRLEQPTRYVGAVLESNDFHPGRSGRDHLRIVAAVADIPRSRVEEVLDTVGLAKSAGRSVKTYSLGMRQRLGIAAALLGEPKLLVLDEPANGMDPAGVQWLRHLLRRFAEDGGTALVSSHILAEVAQSVDRVLIISDGRLVADATIDELAVDGQSLEDVYLELTASEAIS